MKRERFALAGMQLLARMDTFSASKPDEWISFSPTDLTVVVAIARSRIKSERIIVHQYGSHI